MPKFRTLDGECPSNACTSTQQSLDQPTQPTHPPIPPTAFAQVSSLACHTSTDVLPVQRWDRLAPMNMCTARGAGKWPGVRRCIFGKQATFFAKTAGARSLPLIRCQSKKQEPCSGSDYEDSSFCLCLCGQIRSLQSWLSSCPCLSVEPGSIGSHWCSRWHIMCVSSGSCLHCLHCPLWLGSPKLGRNFICSARGSHIGVAVGTYVYPARYPVAAMSFGHGRLDAAC